MSVGDKLHSIIYCLFYSPKLAWLRYSQLIAAVLIFAYFALKPPSPKQAFEWFNVVAHFSGNVLLALSLWYAFFGRWKLRYLLLAAFLYSMLIELAQGLTPSRTPDPMDAVVNSAGLVTGVLLCFALQYGLRYIKRFEQ